MVSVLDSGSKGIFKSWPGNIVLCSWARHFTLTVTPSSQGYKLVGKLSGKPDKMLVNNL